MVLALHVDDLPVCGPDSAEIDKVMADLKEAGFAVTPEEQHNDAFSFLGIEVKIEDDTIKFSQHGLIKKLLETVGMTECNAKTTPAATSPLGTDANGAGFKESWKCSSAVGMMMHLAANAHPEIQFAVHQCARFTHCPKDSHAQGVKRVCKCLQHVLKKDGGLVFHKATGHQLDCCVDADFAGLWGCEDDQDPVCVRSRTGFVMTLADCPVHWVSKLQTVQSLSTLESECVALAQAMREFVPMRRLLKEIVSNLDPDSEGVMSKMKSIVWEDNNGCIATVRVPNMSPRTKPTAT